MLAGSPVLVSIGFLKYKVYKPRQDNQNHAFDFVALTMRHDPSRVRGC